MFTCDLHVILSQSCSKEQDRCGWAWGALQKGSLGGNLDSMAIHTDGSSGVASKLPCGENVLYFSLPVVTKNLSRWCK